MEQGEQDSEKPIKVLRRSKVLTSFFCLTLNNKKKETQTF